jgi:hypothetical protein
MNSDKILVSSYYRGAMNVSNMRFFDFEDTEKAWKHACWCLDEKYESDTRIYIISSVAEPRLIKARPHYSRKNDREAEFQEKFSSFMKEILL